jgi:hypothetical protein
MDLNDNNDTTISTSLISFVATLTLMATRERHQREQMLFQRMKTCARTIFFLILYRSKTFMDVGL